MPSIKLPPPPAAKAAPPASAAPATVASAPPSESTSSTSVTAPAREASADVASASKPVPAPAPKSVRLPPPPAASQAGRAASSAAVDAQSSSVPSPLKAGSIAPRPTLPAALTSPTAAGRAASDKAERTPLVSPSSSAGSAAKRWPPSTSKSKETADVPVLRKVNAPAPAASRARAGSDDWSDDEPKSSGTKPGTAAASRAAPKLVHVDRKLYSADLLDSSGTTPAAAGSNTPQAAKSAASTPAAHTSSEASRGVSSLRSPTARAGAVTQPKPVESRDACVEANMDGSTMNTAREDAERLMAEAKKSALAAETAADATARTLLEQARAAASELVAAALQTHTAAVDAERAAQRDRMSRLVTDHPTAACCDIPGEGPTRDELRAAVEAADTRIAAMSRELDLLRHDRDTALRAIVALVDRVQRMVQKRSAKSPDASLAKLIPPAMLEYVQSLRQLISTSSAATGASSEPAPSATDAADASSPNEPVASPAGTRPQLDVDASTDVGQLHSPSQASLGIAGSPTTNSSPVKVSSSRNAHRSRASAAVGSSSKRGLSSSDRQRAPDPLDLDGFDMLPDMPVFQPSLRPHELFRR